MLLIFYKYNSNDFDKIMARNNPKRNNIHIFLITILLQELHTKTAIWFLKLVSTAAIFNYY